MSMFYPRMGSEFETADVEDCEDGCELFLETSIRNRDSIYRLSHKKLRSPKCSLRCSLLIQSALPHLSSTTVFPSLPSPPSSLRRRHSTKSPPRQLRLSHNDLDDSGLGDDIDEFEAEQEEDSYLSNRLSGLEDEDEEKEESVAGEHDLVVANANDASQEHFAGEEQIEERDDDERDDERDEANVEEGEDEGSYFFERTNSEFDFDELDNGVFYDEADLFPNFLDVATPSETVSATPQDCESTTRDTHDDSKLAGCDNEVERENCDNHLLLLRSRGHHQQSERGGVSQVEILGMDDLRSGFEEIGRSDSVVISELKTMMATANTHPSSTANTPSPSSPSVTTVPLFPLNEVHCDTSSFFSSNQDDLFLSSSSSSSSQMLSDAHLSLCIGVSGGVDGGDDDDDAASFDSTSSSSSSLEEEDHQVLENLSHGDATTTATTTLSTVSSSVAMWGPCDDVVDLLSPHSSKGLVFYSPITPTHCCDRNFTSYIKESVHDGEEKQETEDEIVDVVKCCSSKRRYSSFNSSGNSKFGQPFDFDGLISTMDDEDESVEMDDGEPACKTSRPSSPHCSFEEYASPPSSPLFVVTKRSLGCV
eukprot:m.25552 g.25552  ORF g.25552 m.25552 type:complete len:592 (+) comp5775_c2_seq1:246-2021(+)